MLTINNLFQDLIILRSQYESYGMDCSKLDELIQRADAYYWVNTNAPDCVSDCDLKDLECLINEQISLITNNCTDSETLLPSGASLSSTDVTCSSSLDLETTLTGATSPGTWSTKSVPNSALLDGSTLDTSGLADGSHFFTKTILSDSDADCSNTTAVQVEVVKNAVPQPVNDNCTMALSIPYISAGNTVQVLSGTTAANCPILNSPSLSSLDLPPVWDNDTPGDLWYSFTTNATELFLYAAVRTSTGTMTNSQVAVYRASAAVGGCETITLVGQGTSGGGSVSSTSLMILEANYTYYIRVSRDSTGVDGTFDVVISSNPIL